MKFLVEVLGDRLEIENQRGKPFEHDGNIPDKSKFHFVLIDDDTVMPCIIQNPYFDFVKTNTLLKITRLEQ
ncbi:MAG: hypothetical protein E6R09_05710 [Rhodocyclaceae bacterium]|nr:MAG: hypothetical protein E6R09_05710 [Rhodocyclaceae bacterium]